MQLSLKWRSHLDVPAHSCQQRRQRFVPVVPQAFTVRSASISYVGELKVSRSEVLVQTNNAPAHDFFLWCSVILIKDVLGVLIQSRLSCALM